MEGNEKSSSMHDQWRVSAEKFDYFVLAATGALCAFVSQTFTPEEIAFSPATVELASLLILIGAGIIGFMRLEAANELWMTNFREVFLREESHALRTAGVQAEVDNKDLYVPSEGRTVTPPEAFVLADRESNEATKVHVKAVEIWTKADRYYHWRNYLLLAGIMTLLIARIWTPYYCLVC